MTFTLIDVKGSHALTRRRGPARVGWIASPSAASAGRGVGRPAGRAEAGRVGRHHAGREEATCTGQRAANLYACLPAGRGLGRCAGPGDAWHGHVASRWPLCESASGWRAKATVVTVETNQFVQSYKLFNMCSRYIDLKTTWTWIILYLTTRC
jgi:hypothetical protein